MKIRLLSSLLLATAAVALPAGAATVLPLADADFDAVPNAAWSTFGNAFPDEPAPGVNAGIEGTESLKMFGNFTQNQNFTGAFQDFPVDGISLSVGDQIQLSGLVMHLGADPLQNERVVGFLEITFVDTDLLGEFGFGANVSPSLTNLSPTDQWISLATPSPNVPVEAEFVRVKAVFIQNDEAGVFTGGAAWVDGLELAIVPEPSSMLLLGLSGLALLRRRR